MFTSLGDFGIGRSRTPPTQELYCDSVSHLVKTGGSCRISSSYFNGMWTEYRCNMKPERGIDFMKCGQCIEFRDFLYGAPGTRKTLDKAVRAQAE